MAGLQPVGLPIRVPGVLDDKSHQEDAHHDTGVPHQHVAPLCGWGSDPHGPIFYKGRYHLFYQGRPGTCQWFWGMRWEHCVSNDLVTWLRLPPALLPTPGGLDADGCFTGNIQVHPGTGVPMLFYTGARLRHNPLVQHPDPPAEAANPLMFHWETQLCAVADPDDELLIHWRKVETPWMEVPHCAYLSSWRDPFFVAPEVDPATGKPKQQDVALLQQKLDQLEPLRAGARLPAGKLPRVEEDEDSAGSPSSASAATGLHPRPSGSPGPKMFSSAISDVGATQDGAAFTPMSPLSPLAPPSPLAAGASTAPLPEDQPHPPTINGAGPNAVTSSPDTYLAVKQPTQDGTGTEHMMLIGSGLEGVGGTALVYRSNDLASGWRFDGYLCTWPNLDTGICWECPHLLNLPDLPPSLSCMAPKPNGFVASVSTPAGASGEVSPEQRSKDQELVRLVEAAWVSVGGDPAQATSWVDITRMSPHELQVRTNDEKDLPALGAQAESAPLPSVPSSGPGPVPARTSLEQGPPTPRTSGVLLTQQDASVTPLMRDVIEGVLERINELATGEVPQATDALTHHLSIQTDALASLNVPASMPGARGLQNTLSGLQHTLSGRMSRAASGRLSRAASGRLSRQTSGPAPPLPSGLAPIPSQSPLPPLTPPPSFIEPNPFAQASSTDEAEGDAAPVAVATAAAAATARLLSRSTSMNVALTHALGGTQPEGAAAGAAAPSPELLGALNQQVQLRELTASVMAAANTAAQASASGTLIAQSSAVEGPQATVIEERVVAEAAAAAGVTPSEGTSAQDSLVQAIMAGRQQAAAAVLAAGTAHVMSRAGSLAPGLDMGSLEASIAAMRDSEEAAEPAPTSTLLEQASALVDLKAAGEASMAGLGYAGVIVGHAPRDAAPEGPKGVISTAAAESEAALLSTPAGKGKPDMPVPPAYQGVSKDQLRAACRKYAEAAAAVQGFDLGMPSNDAECVKRCKQAEVGVPPRARPDQRWMLGLAPDAATYGILYFLGTYSHNRFHLEDSAGPFKLDLGNTLYAPVAFYDQRHGRHLVWGYQKELRRQPPPPSMCNKFIGSGCVSLPRALYLKNGRLYQVPIPEISGLRSGKVWTRDSVKLGYGGAADELPVLEVPAEHSGDHLDMELTVKPGTGSFAIDLPSWRESGEGAVALKFNWATKRLDVVYGGFKEKAGGARKLRGSAANLKQLHTGHEVLDLTEGGLHTVEAEDCTSPYTVFVDPKVPPVPDMNPDVPDWIRMKPSEAGGELWLEEGEPLQLRIFLDASVLEVFTGTGQVLCTRVYRGAQGDKTHSGVRLVALEGSSVVERFEVHTTSSAWLRESDVPLPPPVSKEAVDQWKQAGLPLA